MNVHKRGRYSTTNTSAVITVFLSSHFPWRERRSRSRKRRTKNKQRKEKEEKKNDTLLIIIYKVRNSEKKQRIHALNNL